jgi:hypothetical protein
MRPFFGISQNRVGVWTTSQRQPDGRETTPELRTAGDRRARFVAGSAACRSEPFFRHLQCQRRISGVHESRFSTSMVAVGFLIDENHGFFRRHLFLSLLTFYFPFPQ